MKFLQVVFFLTVSWGMFSVVFAYQEQRDHNNAVWYLTNAMTIPEDELAEACRKAVTTQAFIHVKDSWRYGKAKARCEYALFDLDRKR